MIEAVIVTNEELAILCDIVGGWSSKLAENADVDKQQALDRLVANGFVWLMDVPLQNTNTPQKQSCFSPNCALE